MPNVTANPGHKLQGRELVSAIGAPHQGGVQAQDAPWAGAPAGWALTEGRQRAVAPLAEWVSHAWGRLAQGTMRGLSGLAR